jgi:hypothetical protein
MILKILYSNTVSLASNLMKKLKEKINVSGIGFAGLIKPKKMVARTELVICLVVVAVVIVVTVVQLSMMTLMICKLKILEFRIVLVDAVKKTLVVAVLDVASQSRLITRNEKID